MWDEVAALVEKAREALGDPLLAGPRRAVENAGERLRTLRFHLAVLGQFKRGKSTLANALLGRPILPSGLLPVTAIPTFVRRGDRLAVTVHLDGEAPLEIDAARLPEFVSERENPHNRRGVARVEIQAPSALLEEGVILIDTPGIGSKHAHNTEQTLRLLSDCDAALFVVSPDPPVTQVELEFLDAIRTSVPRLFYVINKVDMLDPAQRTEMVGYLREALRTDASIWRVSARDALEGRSGGVPELREALLRFLREEKGATLAVATLGRTREQLGRALELAEIQARSLEMPLQSFREKAERFAAMEKAFDDERRRLADSLAADRQRLVASLRQQTQALGAEAAVRVERAIQQAAAAHRDDRTLRAALDAASGAAIAEFFEGEQSRMVESGREEARAVLESASARAADLLSAAQAEVSELFGVAAQDVSLPQVQVSWRDLYWKTWSGYGHGGALERVAARFRGRRSTVAEGVEECRTLCTRNANVLFNELSARLEDALRTAAGVLDRALVDARRDVQRALEEVGDLRERGEQASGERLRALGGLRERLRELRGQCESALARAAG